MDLFSDMGGALEILKVLFSILAIKFSHVRMQALLTNRLFYSPVDEETENVRWTDLPEEKTHSGELVFTIPPCLDWEFLRY